MAGNKNSGNHNPIPAPKGHSYRVTHGGEQALRALADNRPFKGMASTIARSVEADYRSNGRLTMLEELAIGTHTVAIMYQHAVYTAADNGDMVQLDACTRRYGWLAGLASRIWGQVREEQKLHPSQLSYAEGVQRLIDSENAVPMPEVGNADNDTKAQNDDENA